MPDRDTSKWANVPDGQQSALDYAISTRDQSTIAMVKEAVAHHQVMLAYQPVVQATNQGYTAFYEGLIRVLDETGRIIPAKEFIDSIENTETGRVIDCLALQLGLRALRASPNIRLAINMSARSIGFARWNRILRQGLAADPTVAERLILEITERSAMLVPELVVNFMADLQAKGITFALDDFGAGFTSFRYLRDFYFDILKIDGQFIRDVHQDPDNQVLVRALITIARQFDMFTVAERVERPDDARWLVANGIDCLQGYYFGAPSVQKPWLLPRDARQTA